MKPLRMLDLFAGIGGFSYAGERLVGGFETVAFCEYDEHAQKVLRKHWPDTEIIKDIRDLADDSERFRGSVDIVCGGYPCQPFSLAGVRRGDQDDRHLWPEMLRVIEAVRPRWVCGENVAGHITMGLDTVLSDLQGAGYQARTYVLPAVAADASHRRDRCWIVAYSSGGEWQSGAEKQGALREVFEDRREHDHACASGAAHAKAMADTASQRQSGSRLHGRPVYKTSAKNRETNWSFNGSQGNPQLWEPEPELGRVVDGVRNRVHRLRQLGNSICPQVAARILYAIREADRGQDAA